VKLKKSVDNYKIFNSTCYNLTGVEDASIEAVVTDPPYGISFQNHSWDKDLPNRQIWQDCLRVLKSGSFGLIFSSIRLMHRLMVDVEESGFLIMVRHPLATSKAIGDWLEWLKFPHANATLSAFYRTIPSQWVHRDGVPQCSHCGGLLKPHPDKKCYPAGICVVS